MREGVTVYSPHKVRGKWRMYVETVEEIMEPYVLIWIRYLAQWVYLV